VTDRSQDPYIRSHSRSVEEGERIVRSYFRKMNKGVTIAIPEIVGEGPVRAEHLGPIMRKVDQELDRMYPRESAGGSILEEEIAANANRARIRSVKVGMTDIVQTVRKDRALVREIERKVQE
jgi:hypothetical protein